MPAPILVFAFTVIRIHVQFGGTVPKPAFEHETCIIKLDPQTHQDTKDHIILFSFYYQLNYELFEGVPISSFSIT